MSLIPSLHVSTTPGAPALTGQPGSLVALLDAVLVNGYGTGATAKQGLGWSIEYAATNKRVYRNAPLTGTGYYLRVDDSNDRFALVTAFESMSSIDVGINMFPLASQRPAGAIWPKSGSSDSLGRAWRIYGNEAAFYPFFWLQSQGYYPLFAGDLVSFARGGDPFRFCVAAPNISSYTSGNPSSNLFINRSNWNNGRPDSLVGLVAARSMDGGVVSSWLDSTYSKFSQTWGGGGLAFPHPQIGLMVEDGLVREDFYLARGRYPGLLVPLHNRPLDDGSESTLDTGVKVWAQNWNASGLNGQVLFSQSGADWR